MIWVDPSPSVDSRDEPSCPALPDLKSRQDWAPWIQEVEVFAKLKGLWRYMDPDGEAELERPDLPAEPRELDEAEAESDIPDQSKFLALLGDGMKCFDTDSFNRAVQLHQLRSEQHHRKFMRAMELYRSKMERHSIILREYEKQKMTLDHLFLTMRKTVGPEFRDLIAKLESPRAVIAKLQENMMSAPDEQDKKQTMAEYWRGVIWQGQESREPSPEREHEDIGMTAFEQIAPFGEIDAAVLSNPAAATAMNSALNTAIAVAASAAARTNTPKSLGESASGAKSPKRILCPGCGKGHTMKPEKWWESCWSFLAMHDVGFVPKTFNRIVKREIAIAKRFEENKYEHKAAHAWLRDMKKAQALRGSSLGTSRPQTPSRTKKPEYSFNGQNLIGFAMV